jgi:hypothetical protein
MSRLIGILVCHYLAALSTAYEQLTVVSVLDWPTGSGQLSYIIDGDLTTQWGSNACRGGGWRANKKQNPLFRACSSGICSASCSANVSMATDGSPYTAGKSRLSHAEGASWQQFPFPGGNAQVARSVYIRGIWPVNTTVYATVPAGSGPPIALGVLGPDDNSNDIEYTAPTVPITGIRVQTETRDGLMRGYCYSGVGDCKTITVTEVAVQTEDCYEQITLDLGAIKEVTRLSMKFLAIFAGTMASSVDGHAFVDRLDLKSFPFSYSLPMVVDIPSVTARYLRFR